MNKQSIILVLKQRCVVQMQQQPPYVPRTGLASGAPHTKPPPAPGGNNFDHLTQKPVDLFDPNFLQGNMGGLGGPGSYPGSQQQQAKDLNVVESIFGAQNNQSRAAAVGGQQAPDLSKMSERDRRIYLRDLERANRSKGVATSASSYGTAEPPPVHTTQANIFGEQPSTNAANRREQAWEQKMAQRQGGMAPPQPPPMQPVQPPLPSQGQGFSAATQLNQPLNVGVMQHPSPNTAHRKFKAIGQSPLRSSNILTSAAAQQSPLRSSLTQQKLADMGQRPPYEGISQRSTGRPPHGGAPPNLVGMPPSGASPALRKDLKAQMQGGGLLDAIGNNQIDMQRRQDNRAMQQNEYNKYLASQGAGHQRASSASGRQVPDVNSSLHAAGGMQMIGNHQARQQEDKQRMQREYQSMLNDQVQFKQANGVSASQQQLNEARKKQISDQIFQELMQKEAPEFRTHMAQNAVHQQFPNPGMDYQPSQLPDINQSMQFANNQFLPPQSHVQQQAPPQIPLAKPPRVQSAVGANRKDEVKRMQLQVSQDDPFHKNRSNEHSARRKEVEKKRQYAAMLQEQMALKKQQNKVDLPTPDQLFEQPLQRQASGYPPSQQVDFSNQGYKPQQQSYEPSQYSMHQQVDFGQAPHPGQPQNFGPPPGAPPVNRSFDQHAGAPYQPNPTRPSMSPSHSVAMDPSQQNGMNQKSKQEEYRRELEAQMRQKEEQKKRQKDEQARYEQLHDKDMASYMGVASQAPKQSIQTQQQRPYSGLQGGVAPPNANQVTGGFPNQSQLAPAPFGNGQDAPGLQAPQGAPSAVRLGTDITKRQDEVDPAKLQAKLRYQEEIKQQMEEAKARKEAEKLKRKQQDEEIERRVLGEQEKLNKRDIADIKAEGKRDVPEYKPAKQVRRDQFEPSTENKGIVGGLARGQTQNFNEPKPSTNLNEPPTVSKEDHFTKPSPIETQPLQLHAADNFTLQAHQPTLPTPGGSSDLFGQQPPSSLMPPTAGSDLGSNFAPSQAGPPPPGMGLQSPFDLQPAIATQYSQFPGGPPGFMPPPSAPLSGQQMSTQSDWMAQQQNQATKMFDDQQKMIGMYQQALEQILQYRNQYFEQAMAMRENILKEREQLFEYEKLKQQQLSEMNQLKAVQNQLGNMMNVADQQPVLNQKVAQNLNSYISKQKEQILQMSQSSSNMSKIIREANLMRQKQQSVPPTDAQPQTSAFQDGVSARQSLLEMPKSNPQQVNFSPPREEEDQYDLQKQVDEIAAQIAANDYEQQTRAGLGGNARAPQQIGQPPETPLPGASDQMQPNSYGEFSRNPQFEQSLSSESKMVKVPNQNLLQMAAAVSQVQQPIQQVDDSVDQSRLQQKPGDLLTETWNQESAQKHLESQGILSPTRSSQSKTPAPLALNDQARLFTPKRIGGNLIVNNPRSPMHSSSVVPQTIKELPQEEEKPQNNVDGMRASGIEFAKPSHAKHRASLASAVNTSILNTAAVEKRSEYDLNNRALSGTSSPPRAAMVSIDQREEMEKIEKLVQAQTQSAWADRRATMTGTSFYDNHRQTQKLQEQTQQEEMQKQLARILGSTSQSVTASKEDPLKAMQQACGPDTDRENNREASDFKTQHSSTVKVRASQERMFDRPPANLRIPQADLRGEEEVETKSPTQDLANVASNQSGLIGSEINIAATDQSSNLKKMQEAIIDNTKRTFEPSDVQNESGLTEAKPSSERRQQWNREEPTAQKEEQASLWDDPDLVPVPVLPTFSDNSMTYEVQDAGSGTNSHLHRQIPPSAGGNQPYEHNIAASPAISTPALHSHTRHQNQHSITHTDHTIAGLQKMVPELIATDEFTLEQVHDEATGENRVQLSSKARQVEAEDDGVASSYDRAHFKQQFQTYKQSEPLVFDDALAQVDDSKTELRDDLKATMKTESQIPTQIGASQAAPMDEGMVSARSKKEQEAYEIAEIMRIATQTAKVVSEQKEITLKKQLQGDGASRSQPKGFFNKDAIGTPGVPQSSKMQAAELDATKMQTANANVAPNKLQQMQRAADQMPPEPLVSNDKKILSDLDKIIANLEMQQKNMATFGVPQLPEDEPKTLDKISEENIANSHQPDDNLDEDEGLKTGRSQWTSLSQARQERQQVPPTANEYQQQVPQFRPTSGKAPLDPKGRPKSSITNKSRGASAKGGRSGIDASPQRVGKYAMMALQQGASPIHISSKKSNNASPSPQRLGKFAQLALQKTSQQVVGDDVDSISQKYGRNPSRERVEERSMLSQANESRLMTNQSLMQQQQPPQPISGQQSQPILRPVSGKSNNSRYTAGTKVVGNTHNNAARPMSNIVPQTSGAQVVDGVGEQTSTFGQTMRTAGQASGAAQTIQNDDRGHRSSKLVYQSDTEEEVDGQTAAHHNTIGKQTLMGKVQFSESGRTQQTANEAKYRFNIAEDGDDVNM